MAVYLGEDGELHFKNRKVAKVKDFSISITRDTAETTVLGDRDRTFVGTLRSCEGNANILYDGSDGPTVNLFKQILEDSPVAEGGDSFSLVLNPFDGKHININAIITSLSLNVALGEVIAASISFKGTGAIAEAL